jgi:hypothetical protein
MDMLEAMITSFAGERYIKIARVRRGERSWTWVVKTSTGAAQSDDLMTAVKAAIADAIVAKIKETKKQGD